MLKFISPESILNPEGQVQSTLYKCYTYKC